MAAAKAVTKLSGPTKEWAKKVESMSAYRVTKALPAISERELSVMATVRAFAAPACSRKEIVKGWARRKPTANKASSGPRRTNRATFASEVVNNKVGG